MITAAELTRAGIPEHLRRHIRKVCQTPSYKVKREPVLLRNGPLDLATVWLDTGESGNNTAPIQVGDFYGYYKDAYWVSLK